MNQPPLVLPSPLTGRYYVVTKYDEDTETGVITAHEKFDCTEEVRAIVASRLHDVLGATTATLRDIAQVLDVAAMAEGMTDYGVTWVLDIEWGPSAIAPEMPRQVGPFASRDDAMSWGDQHVGDGTYGARALTAPSTLSGRTT